MFKVFNFFMFSCKFLEHVQNFKMNVFVFTDLLMNTEIWYNHVLCCIVFYMRDVLQPEVVSKDKVYYKK